MVDAKFIVVAIAAMGLVGCSEAPILAKDGESCSTTSDCQKGLKCIALTCVAAEASDSMLGARGESCGADSDCEAGLACFSQGLRYSKAVGPSLVGNCDVANFGLSATGKACWAECKQASDCCELPLSMLSALGVKSCADLAAKMGTTSPSACENNVPEELTRECFAYKAYCDCAEGTWACEAGSCSYTKDCTADGEVIKGCPVRTRSDRATPTTTCLAKTKKCALDTGAAGCTRDTDCSGRTVADDYNDTCSTGECVCLTTSGACYRKCDNDLDCAVGFGCDATRKVCVKQGQCDNDAYCTVRLGDITAKCVESKCTIPCVFDVDCDSSGLTGEFEGEICVAGACTPIGCSSDSECSTDSSVKLFCSEPAASIATETVHSALTD